MITLGCLGRYHPKHQPADNNPPVREKELPLKPSLYKSGSSACRPSLIETTYRMKTRGCQAICRTSQMIGSDHFGVREVAFIQSVNQTKIILLFIAEEFVFLTPLIEIGRALALGFCVPFVPSLFKASVINFPESTQMIIQILNSRPHVESRIPQYRPSRETVSFCSLGRAGHWSNWPRSYHKDLQNVAFDHPGNIRPSHRFCGRQLECVE